MIYTPKKSFGGSYTRQHLATKRTVEVQVTQTDIDQGQPCDAYNCAVKLAVARATGMQVSVHVKDMWLMDGNKFKARIAIPPQVVAWVDRFDRGEKVEPISFTIAF